jgi:hypothetical protein
MSSNCPKLRSTFGIILLVTMTSLFSPSVQSQQKKFEDLWISIPSSPLEIRFNSSRRYSLLNNRSSGRVVAYRVGCVIGDQAEKLKVVREAEPVATDLQPGKVLINSIRVHAGEMERCHEMKTQLAVIQVSFKDGSTWKAASE